MRYDRIQNFLKASIPANVCTLAGAVASGIAALEQEHDLHDMDQVLFYLRQCNKRAVNNDLKA